MDEPDLMLPFRQAALGSPIAWAGLIASLASVYLVARLVVCSACYVALRRWRRATPASWAERARMAYPARRLARVAPLLVAVPLTIALIRDGRRVDLLPAVATDVLIAAAAYLGGLHALIDWARHVNPAWALTPRPARGAWLSWLSWLGPLAALALTLVLLAPTTWDARASAMLAAGTIAVGAYIGWGWRLLMRWTGVFRPAGDRLRGIAGRAADRAGIRLRSVEQAGLAMVNAFAFVHDRSLAVTDAALAVLDDDELAAVCAHEVAHLGESAWVRAARLSSGLLWGLFVAALCLIRPMAGSSDPGIALMIVSFGLSGLIVARALLIRLAHRMEVRADAQAGPAEEVPGAYARALEKIYEGNLVPVVMSARRGTHPELYDRLAALGAKPDYPRPAPPPSGPWLAGLFTLVLGTAAGWFVVTDLVPRRIPRAVFGPASAALWSTGAVGGTYNEYVNWAEIDPDPARGDMEED